MFKKLNECIYVFNNITKVTAVIPLRNLNSILCCRYTFAYSVESSIKKIYMPYDTITMLLQLYLSAMLDTIYAAVIPLRIDLYLVS